jgi:aerobic carbon-monoxide dehydrogenase medium subunit
VYPAEFGYLRATSVAAALEVLSGGAGDDEIKVLAGGQSLLPMMKLRLATPGVLLDIGGLRAELGEVAAGAGGAEIGALATYRSLLLDPAIASRYPALTDALRVLADPQVRARGTIGGAVAHGDPAADLPAVLLALDASVLIARSSGSRTVALDDFLLGVYETDLAEDELVTGVAVAAAPAGQAYEKFEQPASHLPLAGVCAVVWLVDGVVERVRIAVTGVAGRAFRASAAEAALTGREPADEVLAAAAERIGADAPRPLEDIHASGPFRVHLASVLAGRALRRAVSRATGGS